jgi:hypothetical protein
MAKAGVFKPFHYANRDIEGPRADFVRFRRHDAIGRRIVAGTWAKPAKGEPKPRITEEEMAATPSPLEGIL